MKFYVVLSNQNELNHCNKKIGHIWMNSDEPRQQRWLLLPNNERVSAATLCYTVLCGVVLDITNQ